MAKDFLTKIVEHKKEEVAAAKNRLPETRLREQVDVKQTRRPFINKLIKPGPFGVNIIAEIKRASPSKGVICRDLDPAVYALKYEQGKAAALSVLTDQPFFQGSINDLKTAREVTALPVLRKDFLISSYQIYESRVIGADAVLLIVRILSRQQLRDYLHLCDEINIDALVEIHSEKDIETAVWAGAELIGINNRNLSTFKTDIKTAARMASLLEPCQTAVAASGIKTRDDIERLQDSGIWNFLIGESIVRAKNPTSFLNSLIGF